MDCVYCSTSHVFIAVNDDARSRLIANLLFLYNAYMIMFHMQQLHPLMIGWARLAGRGPCRSESYYPSYLR